LSLMACASRLPSASWLRVLMARKHDLSFNQHDSMDESSGKQGGRPIKAAMALRKSYALCAPSARGRFAD
jgi:hypothetical protein